MNLNKFKITDGDLILVTIEGAGVSLANMNNMNDKLVKWAKSKGLNNVEFVMSGGELKVVIQQFTVNDSFEDEVLKK